MSFAVCMQTGLATSVDRAPGISKSCGIAREHEGINHLSAWGHEGYSMYVQTKRGLYSYETRFTLC